MGIHFVYSRGFQSRFYTITRNMSKFCANLGFIFPNEPFLNCYAKAKEVGFKAVESGFPLNTTVEDVVRAKEQAGVEHILINVYTGDTSKGQVGFAAIPGQENNFKESILKTIQYAKALGARKIHIMSGKVEGPVTEANDTAYENNLRYAVTLLEKENILGVIEPINKYSVPNYYMNCYNKALNIVKRINSPNLKIMVDIFHLQLIRGDITHAFRELKDYIGHVQIAQAPDRHEPNTPGEINYKYILESLKNEANYTDWIGLEYKPLGDVKTGLKWINEYGYSL